MADSTAVAAKTGLGVTEREDRWWVFPLAVAVALGGFIVYATWRAFEGAHFSYHEGGAHYLSPFYSPDLYRLFGVSQPPAWLPHSPAFLVLWMPAGFRATCYYFRKAYYRAFFLDPPACGVGEARGHGYRGESSFPLLLQNIHRYFLYLALLLVVNHWYDVVRAFFFEGGFGIGVGSLVLFADAFLLSGYVLGCHSLRHLVGGRSDCFSCGFSARTQHRTWSFVSMLNTNHPFWGWASLFMVGFADLYVRLVAAGVWTDFRIL
jgi:hypothetical protein